MMKILVIVAVGCAVLGVLATLDRPQPPLASSPAVASANLKLEAPPKMSEPPTCWNDTGRQIRRGKNIFFFCGKDVQPTAVQTGVDERDPQLYIPGSKLHVFVDSVELAAKLNRQAGHDCDENFVVYVFRGSQLGRRLLDQAPKYRKTVSRDRLGGSS